MFEHATMVTCSNEPMHPNGLSTTNNRYTHWSTMVRGDKRTPTPPADDDLVVEIEATAPY